MIIDNELVLAENYYSYAYVSLLPYYIDLKDALAYTGSRRLILCAEIEEWSSFNIMVFGYYFFSDTRPFNYVASDYVTTDTVFGDSLNDKSPELYLPIEVNEAHAKYYDKIGFIAGARISYSVAYRKIWLTVDDFGRNKNIIGKAGTEV